MNKKIRKIIVVEDDLAIRELLSEGLKHAGYLVKVAENGADALEKISADKPDLIITDALMPMMNGFELCRKLRADKETKDILILFCTSVSPQELKEKGVNADAFIHKPMDISELYAKIRELAK